MIKELFPIKIMTETIDVEWDKEGIIKFLEEYLKVERTSYELHKEKIFSPIVNFINRKLPEYWNLLEYDKNFPYEITQMWANGFDNYEVMRSLQVGKELDDAGGLPQYTTDLHIDSPSLITAVFYVQKDSAEMGDLFFRDPNEVCWQMQPLKYSKRYKDRYTRISGITGDLILFPSWIQHGVYPNLTHKMRYSLACGIEMKGTANIKKSLRTISQKNNYEQI